MSLIIPRYHWRTCKWFSADSHLIVEEEQGGLSYQLALEFGKGFDEWTLNNMRAFYLAFPIWNAVRTELS